MGVLKNLEKQLEGVFKAAPKLPKDSKESLAKIWPILALVFGILQLLAAGLLWGLIGNINRYLDTANTISLYYIGAPTAYTAADKTWIYVGIAVLLVDAVILLMAYPHLVKRARRGWDLLFIGSLVNVAYSIVSLFIADRGISSFLFGLIGSAVGFYLLFQVKPLYKGASLEK